MKVTIGNWLDRKRELHTSLKKTTPGSLANKREIGDLEWKWLLRLVMAHVERDKTQCRSDRRRFLLSFYGQRFLVHSTRCGRSSGFPLSPRPWGFYRRGARRTVLFRCILAASGFLPNAQTFLHASLWPLLPNTWTTVKKKRLESNDVLSCFRATKRAAGSFSVTTSCISMGLSRGWPKLSRWWMSVLYCYYVQVNFCMVIIVFKFDTWYDKLYFTFIFRV